MTSVEKHSDLDENKKCEKDAKYYINIFLIGGMLLGPAILGAAISCIANEGPIRSYFAILHGYTNKTNQPNLFPSGIWSLGFLYPLGGIFGSFLGTFTVDKIGRRNSNFIFTLAIIIGGIFKVVSRYSHVALLFIGRFFDGIGSAGFMISSILLMLECLPEKLEVIYKPFIGIFINVGIITMGIVTLDQFSGEYWNLSQLYIVGIALLLAFASYLLPESPKFTYGIKRDSAATTKTFKKLRSGYYRKAEEDKFKLRVNETRLNTSFSIIDLLKNKHSRPTLAGLIVLHLGQQLSGINFVAAFAPALLIQARFPLPEVGGIIIFIVALCGAAMSTPLIKIFKRKFLLLTCYLVQIIAFALFTITDFAQGPVYLQIVWLCIYLFFFNIGPGTITWFISVEMFPPQAIGAAQGIAIIFNYLANTVVYLISPICIEAIGNQIIFVYIGFMMITLAYIVFFVAETKNKTYDEIQNNYASRFKMKLKSTQNEYKNA